MSGTKPFSADDDAHRRTLHSYGMNDCEIARRVGVKPRTIWHWRTRRGLAKNTIAGGRKTANKANDERIALYRLGYSDSRIGVAVGMHESGITTWRRRRGLPANHSFGPTAKRGMVMVEASDEDRRMVLYRRGLSDGAIAREVGKVTNAIWNWRQRRGLPANVRERNWDRPATTIVSLDAELGEGGFNRHALIADDAAAEWLEENGATPMVR